MVERRVMKCGLKLQVETGSNEEAAAFASRQDNQVRKAKAQGSDLFPDESAVDMHLKVLFWEGLKQPVKDKARNKKDKCKSFAELTSATRYGEKEVEYVGRTHQTVLDVPHESAEVIPDNPPKGFTQMNGSMIREVKAVVAPQKEIQGHKWSQQEENQVD